MKNIKNVVIVVLVFVVISLSALLLLNMSSKTSNFVVDFTNLQASISYYLGKTSSETFDAYNNVELITGYAEEKEITSFDNTVLVPIADKDANVESNGVKYYKLNYENVKKQFNIDLNDYPELEFYVADGQYLKVKVNTIPKWWNENFDLLSF